MIRVLLWVAILASGAAVVYMIICYVVAARLSAPVRQPVERTPADVGLDYREVGFQSTDGLALKGWWVSKAGSSRAALLVHGISGDKSDPHVVETARVYHRAGFNVLMLDLRANGQSEGERVTLGYREARDVRAAPGSGVAAVVEEAAYADLPPLLRERLPEASGLPAFFNPGIFLMGRKFLGIDPWAVRLKEDARRLSEEGVPFMIIHSRDDDVVPFEHAEWFAAAYPDAVLWELKGYDHCAAYTHPEYRQRLLSFLDEAKTYASGRLQRSGD